MLFTTPQSSQFQWPEITEANFCFLKLCSNFSCSKLQAASSALLLPLQHFFKTTQLVQMKENEITCRCCCNSWTRFLFANHLLSLSEASFQRNESSTPAALTLFCPPRLIEAGTIPVLRAVDTFLQNIWHCWTHPLNTRQCLLRISHISKCPPG